MNIFYHTIDTCLLSQFSQLIVGQISKSGTVLESWEHADFKTVPDFEIWARFDGDIEVKQKGPFLWKCCRDGRGCNFSKKF